MHLLPFSLIWYVDFKFAIHVPSDSAKVKGGATYRCAVLLITRTLLPSPTDCVVIL